MKHLMLVLTLALGMIAPRLHAAEIVVAGGCFWCVEADFERVRGVGDAVSGFTGGSVPDPSYKQVVRGGTGHLEAVRIPYNPAQISLRQMYDMFFRSIDPTDDGGQFCDRGESYRSALFVTPEQRETALTARAAAEAALGRKIVTPILPLGAFYAAEAYHQDYYKSSERILTRFGPLKKSAAYKRYRDACGRDTRVKQLWGDAAAFVN